MTVDYHELNQKVTLDATAAPDIMSFRQQINKHTPVALYAAIDLVNAFFLNTY